MNNKHVVQIKVIVIIYLNKKYLCVFEIATFFFRAEYIS